MSFALVCDALPNIDYVMGLALIDDVHPQLAPLYEFAEMITNSGKPVLPWAFSLDNMSDIYQIALAVAGGEEAFRERPNFALFTTFQSPLQHTDHETANMLLNAEMKLRASLFRTESRGTHYREDYPARDDENWLAWVLLQKDENGEMLVTKEEIPDEWKPDMSVPYDERYLNRFPGELEYLGLA